MSGVSCPVEIRWVRAFARAGISSNNRRLISRLLKSRSRPVLRSSTAEGGRKKAHSEGRMKKEECRNETKRTKSVAVFSSFIILPFAFEMSLVISARTGQGVFQQPAKALRFCHWRSNREKKSGRSCKTGLTVKEDMKTQICLAFMPPGSACGESGSCSPQTEAAATRLQLSSSAREHQTRCRSKSRSLHPPKYHYHIR
jgi:hypothetical protein